MNPALYHSLREEMQQDAIRVERQLDELRKAESFLLRRMKISAHLPSYQAVLNDLAREITQAEADHADLLHLSRFVTRCLIKAYTEPMQQTPATADRRTTPGKEVEPPTAIKDGQKAVEPRTEGKTTDPDAHEVSSDGATRLDDSATLLVAAAANVDSDGKTKSSGPPVPANRLPANEPGVSKSTLPPLRGNTVEFDADGFPILAGSQGNGPAKPAGQSMVPQPEPPTVVFGEDGFPLNLPPNDVDLTLTEPPMPPERTPPKKAK